MALPMTGESYVIGVFKNGSFPNSRSKTPTVYSVNVTQPFSPPLSPYVESSEILE